MDDTLLRAILERIDLDSALDHDASLLVFAACEGSRALGQVLEGEERTRPAAPPGASDGGEPRGAYVKSISVRGFRGIGPERTLNLTPGPGLTLVVGRNGSGKSSFAEGLEMLLTGDNFRWANKKQVVWREGWRNLHTSDDVRLAAELLVEGERGVVTVVREWGPGTKVDESAVSIQPHGKPKTDLQALGWASALATYRPFLSYNELGSMLEEGPSKLYDALSSILGLEELVEAESLLREERASRERHVKEVKARASGLLSMLVAVVDERATRAAVALQGKTWDLDALESIVLGGDEDEGDLEMLRQVAALRTPSVEQAFETADRLREAAAALAAVSGTEADRDRMVAELLEKALDLHADHGDSGCPVCGRGALDTRWRTATEEQIAVLRARAAEAQAAHRQAEAAREAAHTLLAPPPQVLAVASRVELDADEVVSAWSAWSEGASLPGLDDLAKHLETRIEVLDRAASSLRTAARAELERRESAWIPVARQLAEWLAAARTAQRGESHINALKQAELWLKKVAADIRDDRFSPIASKVREMCDTLLTGSNVRIGDVTLEGVAQRRRVRLAVTVDDVETEALGVMSQGELHALALSLFLPRATLPESPFRFVVIDDPVQSMDPARVDGLARVLERVAQSHQVIVFTHDDRLPAAVRYLGIAARMLEVSRDEGSAVTIAPAGDPVRAYIDDALALAHTDDLPSKVAMRTIPGLCRLALEAACDEATRRRRLSRGEPHIDVEDAIAKATTLKMRAALAIFDDPNRAGDVMAWLNKNVGRSAGDVFAVCNSGAHGDFRGGLVQLARDAERLAGTLREVQL